MSTPVSITPDEITLGAVDPAVVTVGLEVGQQTTGPVIAQSIVVGDPFPDDSSGGRVPQAPAVRATAIHSNSDRVSSIDVTIPSEVIPGDTMILCMMYRDTAAPMVPPAGWELNGTYTESMSFNQRLLVFTKEAEAGDAGGSFTWTIASQERMCWVFLATQGTANIDAVTENDGNGTTATIDTVADRLNFTVAHWIYSSSVSGETYSQAGNGVTEITDSPQAAARISGGYTTAAGTVTSTHDASDTGDNPNHSMINIQLLGFGDGGGSGGSGGGSTRPTSGMIYPRGQG